MDTNFETTRDGIKDWENEEDDKENSEEIDYF